jgi:hypothetical protein
MHFIGVGARVAHQMQIATLAELPAALTRAFTE